MISFSPLELIVLFPLMLVGDAIESVMSFFIKDYTLYHGTSNVLCFAIVLIALFAIGLVFDHLSMSFLSWPAWTSHAKFYLPLAYVLLFLLALILDVLN